jgi:hypothetical protein
MSPFSYSAFSTSLRRLIARTGFLNGSETDGACGSPARSADWRSESLLARREKYVCAAASMPYAWLP